MISRNVILTPERLEEELDYFLKQDEFVFDVEAEGKFRGVASRAKVTWIGLATHGRTIVIPMGHPIGSQVTEYIKVPRAGKKGNVRNYTTPVWEKPPVQLRPSQVWPVLEPLFFSGRTKIAHSAVYDLVAVAKYFGDQIPPPPYGDTILAQWLQNENLPVGLKDMVKRRYKHNYDTEGVGREVEKYPFNKVARYNYLDAKYTWLIWQNIKDGLAAEGVENVYRLETDLIPAIADMNMTGAPVDWDRLVGLNDELIAKLVDIEGDMYRAAGKTFNINSNPQKIEVLYGDKKDGGQGLKPIVFTDGGQPSTSAEAIEYYASNPVVQTLTRYQEVNKLLTTYVQAYLGNGDDKECRVIDGRIHAFFLQYGARTGRFSSAKPNLQNVPGADTELGSEIRGLFVAPSRHKLIVADYGQIEMVLLAHYAGPGQLWDGFFAGIDPHTMTASVIFGVAPADVTKAMRKVAKAINFAIVYGAGPAKVAAMAGVLVKEAEDFLKVHAQEFPEIYKLKKAVVETCKSRRPPHIKTILGRKRRLPAIWAKNREISGQAERQAVNSLVQGSSADLTKLAMIRMNNRRHTVDGLHLILTVHDELVSICPDDRVDDGIALIREAMVGEGISKLVKVPMNIDIKAVNRWSEAK